MSRRGPSFLRFGYIGLSIVFTRGVTKGLQVLSTALNFDIDDLIEVISR